MCHCKALQNIAVLELYKFYITLQMDYAKSLMDGVVGRVNAAGSRVQLVWQEINKSQAEGELDNCDQQVGGLWWSVSY